MSPRSDNRGYVEERILEEDIGIRPPGIAATAGNPSPEVCLLGGAQHRDKTRDGRDGRETGEESVGKGYVATSEAQGKPTHPFLLAASPELAKVAVCFQEGFLHQVGGIHLAPQPPADLETGQQGQVIPVPFQQLSQGSGVTGLSQA